MNSSFTFVENKFDPVTKSHKLLVLKHENAYVQWSESGLDGKA